MATAVIFFFSFSPTDSCRIKNVLIHDPLSIRRRSEMGKFDWRAANSVSVQTWCHKQKKWVPLMHPTDCYSYSYSHSNDDNKENVGIFAQSVLDGTTFYWSSSFFFFFLTHIKVLQTFEKRGLPFVTVGRGQLNRISASSGEYAHKTECPIRGPPHPSFVSIRRS